MSPTNFHIINASAGSGKTHTLVLEYLKTLLKDSTSSSFRHLLALTFTNKAVNEMKERILVTLLKLAKTPSKEQDMSSRICEALEISEEELSYRAELMLRKILLEYASFDVITIDKFTHKLVRTFARELELPSGFDVELDPEMLLDETVLSVIEEVGKDQDLTRLLLDFSLKKVQADNDWDVQRDLDAFVRLLLNENDRKPIADIKNKSLKDLKGDKNKLEKESNNYLKETQRIATEALNFLDQVGLAAEDFTRKQLHQFFQKVLNKEFVKLYPNALEAALKGEKPLYNKTLVEEKKYLIDSILSQLLLFYDEIKKGVGCYLVIQNTLKSWTPRLLLQLMEERLEFFQTKKEIRLLGEFNRKINKLVQEEPAPFIYERLGERYQHYFLDEFQDTSELQWSNLTPLISNALESQNLSGSRGSLLIVGDPKQAIYRWRGGNMQQFINLINKTKIPFQIEAENFPLKENFRSGKEIVEFNNSFFSMVSEKFYDLDYQKIYGKGSQQQARKSGGYVRIEAINKGGTVEEATPLYVVKTLTLVGDLLHKEYKLSDIAVLVRKKDQANGIAAALSKAGYSFVSSESLLVSHAKKVQLLLAFLKLTLHPNASEYHKLILDFLWESYEKPFEAYHELAQKILPLDSVPFFRKLNKEFDVVIELDQLTALPVLEAVNYLLSALPILDPNDTHIHFFIEDIFEFSKMQTSSIVSYLKHWELQSEQLRISMPKAIDAIKLMTIHQAKGLEFPIVILPFMDTPLHPRITEKIWFPFNQGNLKSVKWGWFNFSNAIEHYGSQGKELFDNYKLDQKLDALNVLYVALTRAKVGLFVITKEIEKEIPSYAHWFESYVLSQRKNLSETSPFEIGILKNRDKIHKEKSKPKLEIYEVSATTNGYWKERLIGTKSYNEAVQNAQDRGLLIHQLLSKVISTIQISEAIQNALEENLLLEQDKNSVEEKLKEVIHHPQLRSFFDGTDRVLCEQDLLLPKGPTLRPDRINFSNSGEVTIIDYKTGGPKKTDTEQIKSYAVALNDLGYKRINNYLVYINQKVEIVKIN